MARDSPSVSVLLATHGRADLLRRALTSVASQDLGVRRIEVVVVVNGPPAGAPAVVERIRRGHPDLRIVMVESRRAGVAHARQVGMWLATGDFLTILDDDDWIEPGFLSSLLGRAEPGTVPVAWLAEVAEERDRPVDPTDTEPHFDTYLSRAMTRLGPGRHSAPTLHQAVSLNVGKVVPTALARRVRYDEGLRSGSDFVWWTEFFVRHPFRLGVPDGAPGEGGASYVRTTGAGSLSRQEIGWEFNVQERLACVEALERIPVAPGDGEAESLVRAMGDAQSRHLRKLLERQPHERDRVVAEVQKRGLHLVSWSVVNQGATRDLALVYAFSPWSGTSPNVAARRVRERGEVTDLICQDLGPLRATDATSALVADPWIGRRACLGGEAAFADWEATTRFTDGVHDQLETWGRTDSYKAVYSRATWVASHVAAARVKLRHPGLRWIAEFSDPLTRTIMGEVRSKAVRSGPLLTELRRGLEDAGFAVPDSGNLNEWAERLAYALADEVVFTNELQRDYMLGYCPDPAAAGRARKVSRVSPHPTMGPEMYAIAPVDYRLDTDRVHLAYFGVFYPTRGLTELTDALGSLPGRVRSRVRLHVFTNKPEEIAEAVRDAGLGDVVHVEGYRPFLEFLNLTTKFDVLVVNDAAAATHHGGINPYLPSKVSDYLGSGRDIWGVYEPGSVLSTLDLAHRTPLGDPAAAARVLTRLVRDRFGSGPDGTGEETRDHLRDAPAGVSVPQRGSRPLGGPGDVEDAVGSVGQ